MAHDQRVLRLGGDRVSTGKFTFSDRVFTDSLRLSPDRLDQESIIFRRYFKASTGRVKASSSLKVSSSLI